MGAAGDGRVGTGEVERSSPSRMLARGLLKRCPNCGSGRLFETWWRMKERCPRCGLLFAREEGFWFGAYFINFAVVEGAVFLFMLATIAGRANGGAFSVWPLVGAVLAAVVVPFVFYPFSKTVWSALDVIMRPLEPGEARFGDGASDGRRTSPNR